MKRSLRTRYRLMLSIWAKRRLRELSQRVWQWAQA
jgi:hypothetical protein